MTRCSRISGLTIGAALVIFPHTTHGADFVVKGMGMQSCASWTDARSKARLGSDTLLNLSWVLGFVSAENQRLSASAPKTVKSFDLAKGLDLPAIAAWLDKFCAEQPSKPIVAATQALVLQQAKGQGVFEVR
jgi:hypothetical protein